MAMRRARLLLIPLVLLGILWAWPSGEPQLWGYIDDSVDAWEFLRRNTFQVRHGYRRPSWGGLRAQGAKAHVRDNLKVDAKYFTAFPAAGWNNQVIDIMNLAYIAFLSQRIPVLQQFIAHPVHLGGEASSLAVGDVFDLSRLSVLWERPVVELHELKAYEGLNNHSRRVVYDGEHERAGVSVGTELVAEEPGPDEIGCYSARMLFAPGSAVWNPLEPSVLDFIPVPKETHHGTSRENCDIFSIAELVRDIKPPTKSMDARMKEIGKTYPSNMPENQLACVDQVYWCYTHPLRRDLHGEWHAGDGVWSNIGVHMRFQPGLVRLAQDYLRHLFGISLAHPDAPLPEYMALHIRRGDFNDLWTNLTPRDYAYRAAQVLKEARSMGTQVERIVVTTDETDPEWLNQLRAIGFLIVDHVAARTGERLNWWMPTLIDSVILAQAKVLLGNPASTMTILAKRRVIDWNQGFARMMDPHLTVPSAWEWGKDP